MPETRSSDRTPATRLVPLAVGICLPTFFCYALLGLIRPRSPQSDRPEAPYRDFDLEDLFIGQATFPEDWLVDPGGTDRACISAPLDSGCRSLYASIQFYNYGKFPGGGGFEEIHQYLNSKDAAADFPRLSESRFSLNNYMTEWVVPNQLKAVRISADQSRLACHMYGDREMCQMLAQYDEFIVIFHVDRRAVFPKGTFDLLGYSDLIRIVEAIDARMVEMLGREEGADAAAKLLCHSRAQIRRWRNLTTRWSGRSLSAVSSTM